MNEIAAAVRRFAQMLDAALAGPANTAHLDAAQPSAAARRPSLRPDDDGGRSLPALPREASLGASATDNPQQPPAHAHGVGGRVLHGWSEVEAAMAAYGRRRPSLQDAHLGGNPALRPPSPGRAATAAADWPRTGGLAATRREAAAAAVATAAAQVSSPTAAVRRPFKPPSRAVSVAGVTVAEARRPATNADFYAVLSPTEHADAPRCTDDTDGASDGTPSSRGPIDERSQVQRAVPPLWAGGHDHTHASVTPSAPLALVMQPHGIMKIAPHDHKRALRPAGAAVHTATRPDSAVSAVPPAPDHAGQQPLSGSVKGSTSSPQHYWAPREEGRQRGPGRCDGHAEPRAATPADIATAVTGVDAQRHTLVQPSDARAPLVARLGATAARAFDARKPKDTSPSLTPTDAAGATAAAEGRGDGRPSSHPQLAAPSTHVMAWAAVQEPLRRIAMTQRSKETLTTLKTVAEAAAAFDSAAVSTPPVDRIAAVPVPATASGDDAVAVCPHTLTEGRAVPASTVVQAAVAAGPSDRCESSLLERQLHSKPASSAAAPGSGRHGHTSADVTEAPAAVPQPPAPLRRPASLAAGAADRPLHPQAESKAADGDAPWCCDGEGATASDREDADDGFRSNVTAWDVMRPRRQGRPSTAFEKRVLEKIKDVTVLTGGRGAGAVAAGAKGWGHLLRGAAQHQGGCDAFAVATLRDVLPVTITVTTGAAGASGVGSGPSGPSLDFSASEPLLGREVRRLVTPPFSDKTGWLPGTTPTSTRGLTATDSGRAPFRGTSSSGMGIGAVTITDLVQRRGELGESHFQVVLPTTADVDGLPFRLKHESDEPSQNVGSTAAPDGSGSRVEGAAFGTRSHRDCSEGTDASTQGDDGEDSRHRGSCRAAAQNVSASLASIDGTEASGASGAGVGGLSAGAGVRHHRHQDDDVTAKIAAAADRAVLTRVPRRRGESSPQQRQSSARGDRGSGGSRKRQLADRDDDDGWNTMAAACRDDDDFKRAMCFESLNGTDVRLVWGDCTSALWPDSNLGTSAKRGQGLVGCDGVSVFEDIGGHDVTLETAQRLRSAMGHLQRRVGKLRASAK